MKRVGISVFALIATLSSCGGDPISKATDSSLVTVATLAPTTVAPATVVVTVLVTSADTSDTTSAPTPTTAMTALPTTKPKSPGTKAPTTTSGSSATTTPQTAAVVNYKLVNPPTLPKDQTADVAGSGPLLNGVYWVDYSGGDKNSPTVQVRRAFFGAACVAEATANSEQCTDDLYIPGTPDREMTLTFASTVKLTVSDQATQKSYQITPDELVRIRASSPSAGAPDNFSYTPFAFLATVANGKVTKFEQVWTP